MYTLMLKIEIADEICYSLTYISSFTSTVLFLDNLQVKHPSKITGKICILSGQNGGERMAVVGVGGCCRRLSV